MIKAYIKFWRNYANFDGKSSRSDYWWVFLVNSIIRAIIIFGSVIATYASFSTKVDMFDPNAASEMTTIFNEILVHPTVGMITMKVVGVIFSLFIMIPVTTLTARRLRDAGLSAALVYPLPAIYLIDAVMEFVSFPAAGVVSLFFVFYAVMLLFLCSREGSDKRQEKI